MMPLQFFSDARDSETYLKNLQDTIRRKYSCDRNTSLTRLEDLLQDSMVGTSRVPLQVVLAGPAKRGSLPCFRRALKPPQPGLLPCLNLSLGSGPVWILPISSGTPCVLGRESSVLLLLLARSSGLCRKTRHVPPTQNILVSPPHSSEICTI